jgi:hypothetical protein
MKFNIEPLSIQKNPKFKISKPKTCKSGKTPRYYKKRIREFRKSVGLM